MKKTLGEKIFGIFNIAFMLILILITAYPIWHVIMASFSNSTEFVQHSGFVFAPVGFSLKAYQLVFKTPMILTGYLNTLTILAGGLTLSMIMTILAAYALSRRDLYGKKAFLLFIVFTMYFHGGLIPFYFTVKGLGIADTLWALIIPGCLSTFNFIIMRTAFAALPASLDEAAKIDGANDFLILTRIVIPLSMPVIAVIILYYSVGIWNSWFNALIFIRNKNLFPLQIVLREILIQNDTSSLLVGSGDVGMDFISETLKYATICVATLPILILYPFLQKYFTKGVMVGAIKG
jgi:putative aldouronate transport system permease protein